MLSISDKEFEDIRALFFKLSGARLRDTKRPLVISRLRRRLEELNCQSFTEYLKILTPQNTAEIEFFTNALTTNETFFFRHGEQFNFLYEEILPYLKANNNGKIEIWSAASSTGEEPYSIAMTLMEFFKNGGPPFKIYASDINSEVIKEAQQGIYDERAVKEVPSGIKDRYFRRNVTSKDGVLYEVTDQVKAKVEFFQHNLQHHPSKSNMDVIFLRNVLIYFDRDIKEKVVNLLEPSLKPKGYFLISLAENLGDIRTSLKLLGAAIYRKP